MESETNQPKWKPIGSIFRRVLGVLVEKAKTTPDNYPMTINAIVTGSNQKSNRSPKMDLSAEDVEDAMDELRRIGAVAEIQGDGRKFKYRHLLYEWLGVDKVQLAVMAELLLRGEQTLGELRARASRMESIDGLDSLKPVVQQLIDRDLILPLTPEGRGQLVTHCLYLPEELAELQRRFETGPSDQAVTAARSGESSRPTESPLANNVTERRLSELEAQLQQLVMRIDRLEARLPE